MDRAIAEALRKEHKPKPVCVAFVGESAPAGDTFFYAANSTLYYETRDAFERALPANRGSERFLERFEALGCYLDDLCLTPVNRLADDERRQRREEAVEPLAARLRDYAPEVVVAIGKTTAAPHVRSALRHADLAAIPFHIVSFPGRPEHRVGFHREMDSILDSVDWTRT
jgi:hypothetical protein